MGNFEQRDNTGNLFKNDYKKADNHPDYKGKVLVNGKDMDIAAWIKEGRNGKFMSLSFSEPYQKEERQEQKPQSNDFEKGQFDSAGVPEEADSEIPF